MTPTKEQIERLLHCIETRDDLYRIPNPCSTCGMIDICLNDKSRLAVLVTYTKAKCAEVEALKELIEEVVPVGDIADGLAPYYIEADTIRRMRKALEGKE